MTHVPFYDFQAQHAEVGEKIEEASQRVLRSGWYLLGKELLRFEVADPIFDPFGPAALPRLADQSAFTALDRLRVFV